LTGYASAPGGPQRILLVCHYYAPHIGGIELVVQAEAERLAAEGHEVVVLTSAPNSGDCVENGVRIVRVAAWNGLEDRLGVPFPFFSPRILGQALRLARRADVVHVHDCFYLSSWSAGLGSLLTRTPMVLSQHVAVVDHPSFAVSAVQKLVYGTVGRALLRRARRVFVINEYVGRFVTGLGAAPAKLVVLSNGVDGERFRPAAGAVERAKLRASYGLPGDDRPLVLFVGRLVPKKGIGIAVEALEGVADLVTVGSGDASAVTGRPGVHHLGSRQPEEVAEIFRCCDVLVLPTTGEVFPLVVREAMSTGLPVVTTDEPDYAALGVDGMAQVPRRAEAVREAVRDLLANAARRDRMRAYSLEYAREYFSWSEHLDLLTSHYRDVAVGGGAGGEKGGPR
jgi:D-inositol-3-phosphate glycosyltransferase